MKSIQRTYVLFGLTLLAACSLDEDARSLITPDEFFLEDRDAQSAVDAIYHSINSGSSVYAKYYWLVNAMASDLGTDDGSDPDIAEFSRFQLTAQNKIVDQIWTGLYQGINQANFAIERIPSTPTSNDAQIKLLAEARFLRAFFYFDLMRFFGEIPLITQSTSKAGDLQSAPRNSINEIATFLEAEFTFAFENLPTSPSPGRPGSYTAAGYLCKLYLTTKEYNKAFQASRIIIASGQYSLVPDFANLFKAQNQNNTEVLWSVNLDPSDGGPMNQYDLPRALGGRGQLQPVEGLLASFTPLDRRYAQTIKTGFIDGNGMTVSTGPFVAKYWDVGSEPLGGILTGVDIPLLRYAEVLLLHAESLNQLRNGTSAESLTVINVVRARARFDGEKVLDILPDVGRLDKGAFASAILDERKRELAWEGHRWFDLVRYEKLEEEVRGSKPESAVQSKHYLLPIPARQLKLNDALGGQNPGY